MAKSRSDLSRLKRAGLYRGSKRVANTKYTKSLLKKFSSYLEGHSTKVARPKGVKAKDFRELAERIDVPRVRNILLVPNRSLYGRKASPKIIKDEHGALSVDRVLTVNGVRYHDIFRPLSSMRDIKALKPGERYALQNHSILETFDEDELRERLEAVQDSKGRPARLKLLRYVRVIGRRNATGRNA